MTAARTPTNATSASQTNCMPDTKAWATTGASRTVAVAVAEVRPLARVTVARHEPTGRLCGRAKVTFHDCPGARVTIRCTRKGPALLPPGPSDRRTVPLRSIARSPVLFTWATMTGWPEAVTRPVMEVMSKLVGGTPRPTAR